MVPPYPGGVPMPIAGYPGYPQYPMGTPYGYPAGYPVPGYPPVMPVVPGMIPMAQHLDTPPAGEEEEEIEEIVDGRKVVSKKLGKEDQGFEQVNPPPTYGFEDSLNTNIRALYYFQDLQPLTTVPDFIDEIVREVRHLEAWVPGADKNPSVSFCILLKLLTLKLSVKQVRMLLDHKNAYVRGIGFLYLRYACPYRRLWEFFEPYLDEDVEFNPTVNGPPQTLGAYIRDLLLEQHYGDTIFPRIPVPILKDIKRLPADYVMSLDYSHTPQRRDEGRDDRREGGRRDDGDDRREARGGSDRPATPPASATASGRGGEERPAEPESRTSKQTEERLARLKEMYGSGPSGVLKLSERLKKTNSLAEVTITSSKSDAMRRFRDLAKQAGE
ncbi:putative pre-mRNA splicing factor PRP38 family protein [Paratrimastix pyriformis]|uniref:Pre-mRNA-splicing factor 38 n=1 Tax=Paratrimastix pyriformis TaxID=342808 RepID=A0ABQ8UTC3_9EUKA|nr:putative pre-mRNA splicing factor PRP38 family protein [Paratrimastix pyriformis]